MIKLLRGSLGAAVLAAIGCAGSPPPRPAPHAEPASLSEAPPPEAVPEAPDDSSNTAEPAKGPEALPETPSQMVEEKEVAAPPPEPVAAAKPPPEIEGKLVLRAKNKVRVKLAGDLRPEKDQTLRLLRFFSGKAGDKSPIGALAGIFGGKVSVSGWVSIADVRVTKVDGAMVTLEIVKEKTRVVVNGKRVNHFTPGAKLKLTARD